MISLIVKQTYSCSPVGNSDLNHFKFWRSPMSEKKRKKEKKDYILVFKVIHITLAQHQNEIIWFEEKSFHLTQPHTPRLCPWHKLVKISSSKIGSEFPHL